jgi:DNA-binding GntR family transcriptional regulator
MQEERLGGGSALAFLTREQAVYNHLRHAITQGHWGPDQPLVALRIATDLGVSRITIANALKRLAAEGFVRLVPHKEAVVAPITAPEVEDIYHARAALEAEAASVAALRADSAWLVELRQLNEYLANVQPTRDPVLVRAADKAFHARLGAAASLPGLAAMIANLVDRCEYYRARMLDVREIVLPDARRHAPLLKALSEHNAEQARAMVHEHVVAGMRAILGALAHGGHR